MTEDKKDHWWSNLNDTWSKDKVTYLTAGQGLDATSRQHFMGDFVFHRFFGTDDYDAKHVKVVMVEAKKWDKWNQWLKNHRADKTLLPIYAVPVEQILMSKKSFRIVRWVDEYRPFDFFPAY